MHSTSGGRIWSGRRSWAEALEAPRRQTSHGASYSDPGHDGSNSRPLGGDASECVLATLVEPRVPAREPDAHRFEDLFLLTRFPPAITSLGWWA